MTPAMFEPQWQMKTPMRGSSALMSRSTGYSFSTVSVPRESASPVITWAAAAEAWATLSGMSLGSPNGPTTKTPSRLVARGANSSSLQKPWRLSSMPRRPAASCALRAGSRPTESTTMSYSLVRMLPCSSSQLMSRSFVSGSSLMADGRERMKRTPRSRARW